MAPRYKIALIQLHPEPLSPASNFSRSSSFLRLAASAGTTLAVLPEYHLTSFLPSHPTFPSLCAQSPLYLSKYQTLARELHINIVPGTLVEVHTDEATGEERMVNTAYFIDSEGELRGRYEKKNLWHPERTDLRGSKHERHQVFDTALGKVGMLICWDLAFPEAFRELVAQGARLIIVPTYWTPLDCSPYGLALNPDAEALFLSSTLTARAFENTCAVVFVNAGGPPSSAEVPSDSLEPSVYAGMSRVTLPFLGALGDETKDSAEEGMSIVEVDMEVLDEAEKQYKVREDIAREDWHYVYRHDSWGKEEGKGR